MKSLWTAILLLIVLQQCSSVDKNITQQHKNYTNSDIQGNWKLIHVEIIEEQQSIDKYKESAQPEVAREWSAPVFLNEQGILQAVSPEDYLSIEKRNLNISKDSIFWLNYPLELYQRSFYSIESNLLKTKNDPNGKHIVLSTGKDTLWMAYLDQFGLYLKETYQRVMFNDSILDILKQYKINFPMLAGTWELIREAPLEYGAIYTLDFPYTIPDTIILTKEELLSTLHSDRSYQMLTDGKKRKYFLGYNGEQLLLSPDNWYKEADPFIHFRSVK